MSWKSLPQSTVLSMNLFARASVFRRTLLCVIALWFVCECPGYGLEMANEHSTPGVVNEGSSSRVPATWKRIVGPIDVGPIGWRRTTRGWERAEHWEVAVGVSNATQINRVIQKQKFQEQGTSLSWCVAMVLSFVRRIDPVTLISTQVCLLALYVALVFHRRERRVRSRMAIDVSS